MMMSLRVGRIRVTSSSAIEPKRPVSGVGQLQKDRYRILVMGGANVGKTCIITRFLFEKFISEYKATVEEMYSEEYIINGMALTMDFLDTAGSYEFPAMRRLSISTADAVILVYSVDDEESFEEVKRLRQQVIDEKGDELTPIVIVGNKSDLSDRRQVHREMAETTVSIDWGNGYVESSAKDNINISGIFKELLRQANVQVNNNHALLRRYDSSPVFCQKTSERKKNKRNSCALS